VGLMGGVGVTHNAQREPVAIGGWCSKSRANHTEGLPGLGGSRSLRTRSPSP